MSWLFNLPPGAALEHLIVLLGALAVGAVATRVVMHLAPRWDFVSRPKGERWSKRPVPMGGGIALFVVLAPGLAWLSLDLFVAATVVFLLGLIDDRRPLSPIVKLAVQALAAGWMVLAPLDGDPAIIFEGPLWLVLPVTAAWYVGMANSVNLLDNMDGSAAGVAAVAAGFIYILAVGGDSPDPRVAASAAVAVGAAAGFLIFNFPPARIFMGDAGSLLLGFALAGLALRLPRGEEAPVRELAVAAFILGIPLFDTALVWVSRRAARRPFLQGGRDHTTHRLMALGLSERRTVLVLYGVAAALGGIGIAVARGGLGTAVITAVVGGITLVFVGVFLGDVAVYRTAEGRAAITRSRHPIVLYGVELFVDVAILSAAWFGAYAIRFGDVQLPESGADALPFYLEASALPALPFVIAFKVSALVYFNLYRGFWRTIRFADVVSVAKALTLASVLIVVAATVLQRFENYSRGVIAIDWLLSLMAVLASRSALRVLRETLARLVGRKQRAMLAGSLALKPLVEHGTGLEAYELLEAVLTGEDPEGLVADAQAQEVEVVLLGEPWEDDDPRLTALLGAGIQVRRLVLALE